jgi:glycosyltransferase involved in cell wall biosynthesis
MKILLFANTDWYLYNFRRGLITALRDEGHDVVLVSPPGRYSERFAGIGVRWIPLPMDRRSLNPMSELKVLGELRAIYAREQPDLVHHFTLKPVCYGSIAAFLAGTPASVNSITGLGYVFSNDDLRARALRPLLKRTLRLALRGASNRTIFQNSDDQALFLDSQLTTRGKARLIRGSGVDTARFCPGQKATDRERPFRILMATRLLWNKGVAEFVEAARTVKAQAPWTEFILAGAPDAGNPDSVPESEIEAWRAKGLIELPGHVEDMEALLKSVDMVALPSYAEGVPRVLLEAAACGLPIVATDVRGCREVVEHDRTGLLVPAKDAQALAEAIAVLVINDDLRKRLGDAARAKMIAEFEERIVVSRTIDVYGELVPELRRAAA